MILNIKGNLYINVVIFVFNLEKYQILFFLEFCIIKLNKTKKIYRNITIPLPHTTLYVRTCRTKSLCKKVNLKEDESALFVYVVISLFNLLYFAWFAAFQCLHCTALYSV